MSCSRFRQAQTLVLAAQFSSMEHDAVRVPHLSDKMPDAAFSWTGRRPHSRTCGQTLLILATSTSLMTSPKAPAHPDGGVRVGVAAAHGARAAGSRSTGGTVARRESEIPGRSGPRNRAGTRATPTTCAREEVSDRLQAGEPSSRVDVTADYRTQASGGAVRFSACCVSIRTSCFTSSMLRVIPACASRFSVRSRSSGALISARNRPSESVIAVVIVDMNFALRKKHQDHGDDDRHQLRRVRQGDVHRVDPLGIP